MRYEHSREDQYLMHYGVPGMHWGVITKEYQPVAFDKRKNPHRKKMSQQELSLRERARRNGSVYGDHLFWQARHENAKRIRDEGNGEEELDEEKDYNRFTVENYAEKVANFLSTVNDVENMTGIDVKSVIHNGARFIKGLGKKKMSSVMKSIRTKSSNYVKKQTRSVINFASKTKSAGIKLGKRGIQNSANFIKSHAKTAISFLSRTGSAGVKMGKQGIQSGAKIVARGALALIGILKKIRR